MRKTNFLARHIVATRTQPLHGHARNQTEKYTNGEGTTLDMKMKEQCNIKQDKTNLT